MASVVFEKQLANIKKGLELLHEMTQSMQELTDLSNENFMQKNIAQIQKANNELGNTAKKMQGITQQSKKSFDFKPGIKSINALKLGLTAVGKLLDGIYQKTKMIVFAGIAAFAGMGFMASNQSKKNNQAKDIGLSPAKMLALENAGKIKAGDSNRYVESFINIKTNATSNNASDFATLSLNYADFADMSDPNQMFEVFNAKAQEINKMKGPESEHLREAFKNIVGHSTTEFHKAGAYTEYLNQHKEAQKAGLDSLGGAGESFDRALAQLQMTLTTIVSKLAPFITQISDAFTKGLRDLLNNKEFNAMLKNFGKAMEQFGNNLSTNIIDFFKNLPEYIEKVKNFFQWVFDKLMGLAAFFGNDEAKEYKKNKEQEKVKQSIKTFQEAQEIIIKLKKQGLSDDKLVAELMNNKEFEEKLKYFKTLSKEQKEQVAKEFGMDMSSTTLGFGTNGSGTTFSQKFNEGTNTRMEHNNMTRALVAHITINNADGSTNQTMQTIRLEGGSR